MFGIAHTSAFLCLVFVFLCFCVFVFFRIPLSKHVALSSSSSSSGGSSCSSIVAGGGNAIMYGPWTRFIGGCVHPAILSGI